VRDPLDPANPYKSRYAPYDVWIYVQAYQQAQGQQIDYGSDGNPAGMWYSLSVDEDGWPVPLKVEQELYYQPSAAPDGAHADCRRAVSAFGFMNEKLEQQQQLDMLDVKAKHLPKIPQWLAERAPEQALVLPGGEVITKGPADSGTLGDPGATGRYYRYSASGAELGSAPGPYWWRLYFLDFDKLEARHNDSYWLEYQGYVTRYHTGDNAPQETYDYTGERIHDVPTPRAAGSFEWLQRDGLRELYERQSGDHQFGGGTIGA
jgi:hypothetical protein